MSSSSPLEKVAIVGATGHIGKYLTEALVETGKHTVTALARAESKRPLPDGVKKVVVNFADKESIAEALRGQQFLIITLPARANDPTLESRILSAAAEAGARWVMPNAYSPDSRNPKLAQQRIGPMLLARLAEIEKLGLSYVTLACGVWYEWSLALGEPFFGFQIKERKVTFYDDGKIMIATSTWVQCGRAVAALLSLPESAGDGKLSLDHWKNDSLRIQSFELSQRDILDSLHRVLGTTDADWTIKYQSTAQRVKDGQEEFAKGDFRGFAKMLYATYFISSKAGDLAFPSGPENEALGLPKENLDEATKRAIEMVESGFTTSS